MKPWEFEANAMVANSKCSPEDARTCCNSSLDVPER